MYQFIWAIAALCLLSGIFGAAYSKTWGFACIFASVALLLIGKIVAQEFGKYNISIEYKS